MKIIKKLEEVFNKEVLSRHISKKKMYEITAMEVIYQFHTIANTLFTEIVTIKLDKKQYVFDANLKNPLSSLIKVFQKENEERLSQLALTKLKAARVEKYKKIDYAQIIQGKHIISCTYKIINLIKTEVKNNNLITENK